eukprot:GHVU01067960.1.p7 GENE.GHVU01067960.1~~GHVU01067960.1.p7  ORF type:complete len:101 (+),score=4.54 GHVU01067960.1:3348-3650(+)
MKKLLLTLMKIPANIAIIKEIMTSSPLPELSPSCIGQYLTTLDASFISETGSVHKQGRSKAMQRCFRRREGAHSRCNHRSMRSHKVNPQYLPEESFIMMI